MLSGVLYRIGTLRRRDQLAVAASAVLLTLSGCAWDDSSHVTSPSKIAATTTTSVDEPEEKRTMSALDFTMKNIHGDDTPLDQYRGDVVLIVNVASKCGLTPQYADLQSLHDEYADEGLKILGFPANDFNLQEPGSNEQIIEFCTTNYNVTFDMYAKIVVHGEGQAPLYEFLTSKTLNPDYAGDIEWNFTKFLLDREGRIIARFGPRVQPTDQQCVTAIEAALGAE